MLHRCSVRIASFFVSTGHIKSELADLCRYAIERRVTSLVVCIFCILLGIWFMPLFHLLFFTLFFIVPRKLIGGYHAKTPFRCALLSLFSIILAGLLAKLLATNTFNSLLVLCAGSYAIIFFCFKTFSKKQNFNCPQKTPQLIIGMEFGLLFLGFASGLNSELLLCAAQGISCATISFIPLQIKGD